MSEDCWSSGTAFLPPIIPRVGLTCTAGLDWARGRARLGAAVAERCVLGVGPNLADIRFSLSTMCAGLGGGAGPLGEVDVEVGGVVVVVVVVVVVGVIG